MSERREFFTASGGYVLLHPAATDEGSPPHPALFACTAGDNDMGVQLEDHEQLQLGLWLLDQVMDEWERGQVHRLLQLTRRRLQLDPEPMPDYDEQGRAQLDPEPF